MSQQQDISDSELKFILEGCRDNCREDGRARDEFRCYTTITGKKDVKTSYGKGPPLVLSQGSARVVLATGETQVLVSVKAELINPPANRPNHGVLSVHVDDDNKRGEELESIFSSLLLPHLVDTKNLCIVPGIYAWRLSIDVFVLDSSGGSLLDACGFAITKALNSTVLPCVTFVPAVKGETGSLQIDSDFSAGVRLRQDAVSPVLTTATMMKTPTPVFILDATKAEESCAHAQIHIVVDASDDTPKILSLQTSGKVPLPLALFQDASAFVLESARGSSGPFNVRHYHNQLLQSPFALKPSLPDSEMI